MKKSLKKKLGITITAILGIPTILLAVGIGIVYLNQDKIVQTILDELNKQFAGTLRIEDSHISPFHNFPYISVDMENIALYEGKDIDQLPILEVQDAYVGFSLWDVIGGNFQIKTIELKQGRLDMVQHASGQLNIVNAFSAPEDNDTTAAKDNLHLELKKLKLIDIQLSKRNETDSTHIELFVHRVKASFKTTPEHLYASLQGKFELDVANGADTMRFLKHKHIGLNLDADFDKDDEVLRLSPSELKLEGISFGTEGSILLKDDVDLDLKIHGQKSDFNLLFAFLPEDLAQYMQRYKNAGELFFNANIKGKSINGNTPSIEASFGCKNGFFENKEMSRKLESLAFTGYFTNGAEKNAQTSEVRLLDVFAKPEQGVVQGNLVMRNFNDPRVDLKIFTDFDLKFLTEFLQLDDLKDLSGKVMLNINLDELVDIQLPESSLRGIQKGVDSKLEIRDLHFRHPSYPLAIKNLNLIATMSEGNVNLEKMSLNAGKSDIFITGHLEKVLAILHKENEEIAADLHIKSKHINITELTSFDTIKSKPFKEELSNLDMRLSFKGKANEIVYAKPIPVGEFFIDDFSVKLKNYPHHFHDFHADIFIRENELEIKDFSGEIDKTDLHFSGKISDYNMWFLPHPKGDAKVNFDLVSHQLVLHDLLSYNGENHLPEEYRSESLKELRIHGLADFHYDDGFKWLDVDLDKLEGKMNVHPLKLERFKGKVHYQDHRLTTKNFSGQLGNSDFMLNMSYYLKTDSTRKGRENFIVLKSTYLDFDQLTNFNVAKNDAKTDHDSVFNVFELPFSNTKVEVDIGGMNYHKIKLKNISARLRLQENHFLYIDTLQTDIAGGHIHLGGYFNGSNPKQIYFSPNISFKNLDIDQMLFKFDNLGNDEYLSNTIHGKVSGKLTGKLHMHTDLVPIIEDSEIHLDVMIIHGQLVKFKPMEALSSYFRDKNLSLIRFDTLQNKFDLKNGTITVPAMTINSSLGFIEISGKQNLNADMEYYIKIPWQLVTDVGAKLLFGGKKKEEVDPDQVDEIVYRDMDKKIRFVHLKISGNPDNLKVGLGKEKRKNS